MNTAFFDQFINNMLRLGHAASFCILPFSATGFVQRAGQGLLFCNLKTGPGQTILNVSKERVMDESHLLYDVFWGGDARNGAANA
jgi:hypothetical protein